MPTSRSFSTTGICRNLPVVIRSMMETAVSASPQVAISRVMACASRLVSASAPSSANSRTMSRSDKMPITRRSAPSTTTAPIRCSANFAIAASRVALGSIVTTSLPFLDTIALTVIRRLPPPATSYRAESHHLANANSRVRVPPGHHVALAHRAFAVVTLAPCYRPALGDVRRSFCAACGGAARYG
jgi:hypothetical protein